MYEENPYAVPESSSGFGPAASSAYPTDRFYVDGHLIMCSSPVALPPICVVTGETDDIVLIRKTVTWVPKWIYLTLLAGVLLLAIVYLAVRKECKTSYYLSRKLRNRKRWLIFGGIVGFVGGIVLMIAGGDSQIPEILVPVGILSLLGSLVMIIMGQLPISAQRQERSRCAHGCRDVPRTRNDARHVLRNRHERQDRHRARDAQLDAVLPARVVWAMHTVSRRQRVALPNS